MKWLPSLTLACSLAVIPAICNAMPQTLTISLGAEPDSGFDPVQGWGKYNNPLFQSTLVHRSADLSLKPELADKWQLSPDRMSWTVQLKPGLKFSDGSVLDANDVKYTFDTAAKSTSEQDLTMVKSVEVKTPLELVFHLKHPDISFVDLLATLGIVPSDSYGPGYGNHPVGSGPYEMVRWDKGQQLVAKTNPYYIGHKPEFNRLVILFGTEDSRFTQLQAGQLDVAAVVPRYAHHIPAGYKLWRITSVDSRGVVWPMTPPEPRPGHPGEMIGNAVSSDPAIRDAANLAVDRNVLVNQLLDGYARPAFSIADGLPWGIKLTAPKGTMTERLARARALLAKAGWQMKDGVLQKQINGKTVQAKMTLYYLAGDSIREQLSLAVAQMLKPLGIILQPRGNSWEVIATKMFREPVMMGYGSHSANEVYFTHHSRYAGEDFYNSGYYQNPKVDAELDKARQADSWAASLPYWRDAERLIAKDQPWTWLVNLEHLYAAKTCIDLGNPGIEPHGHGWPLINNITDWRWTCR
ncbi:peptide-binding protein [Shewanella sp. NFH-SH190041]|uniref:ABC transporter substrate-binding protein n=1 Tax=Shewanella sp. NFH-SH190041 TaxID=2950245 RepID=UPI0021C2DB8D|nr:ABC transporter substrate-binding protein [Shewanella sp. NFH-SH190041]BDM64091.1 peptide-binding protein [Shewanella sp. NFH-SH190041]